MVLVFLGHMVLRQCPAHVRKTNYRTRGHPMQFSAPRAQVFQSLLNDYKIHAQSRETNTPWNLYEFISELDPKLRKHTIPPCQIRVVSRLMILTILLSIMICATRHPILFSMSGARPENGALASFSASKFKIQQDSVQSFSWFLPNSRFGVNPSENISRQCFA